VARNVFIGPLPAFAGPDGQLSRLFLYDNLFSGSFENIFTTTKADTLVALEVENNALTGTIPSTIGLFQRLVSLWVHTNILSGTVPTEIGHLTALVFTFLYDNLLTGMIPSEVGNLVACTRFFANGNMLSGTIPAEFGNLREMEVLEIGFNELTGTIPSELGNSVRLTSLGVYGNGGLSGRLESMLDTLPTRLAVVHAGETSISGSIPTSVGRFFQLELLNIPENQLSGMLPSEIGLVSTLVRFNVLRNQLSGTLPSELGLLGALTSLSFGANRFTGTLAPEFVGWTSLTTLSLSENAFTGSPSVLANLPRLRKFRFDESSLICLFALSQWNSTDTLAFPSGTLFINGNEFHDLGGLCNVKFEWVVFAANSCGSDQYNCSCCSQCCDGQSCTSI